MCQHKYNLLNPVKPYTAGCCLCGQWTNGFEEFAATPAGEVILRILGSQVIYQAERILEDAR